MSEETRPYKPRTRAYIRAQTKEGKWINQDISEMPDPDFKAIIVDLLVKNGLLVGVKKDIE